MKKLILLLMTLMLVRRLQAQAPGDEDDRCTVDHTSPQVYPDTVRNLMDSYNYEQLLPGNGTGNPVIQGAVWNDRSYDGNDETNRNSPTYWQHGAGGICRYQTTVCGWRREGALQNNWLFTQHIHKDFDPNIYNYPVEIHVEITHALKSCRERLDCHPRVYVHNYITNTVRLPSTEGAGFMNTQHYTELGVLHPPLVSLTYVVTLNFTLQPSQTGFYIAVRDNGTCFGISRVQVYRDNCKSFQRGLVLYPDAPAPVSDSVNINIQCVANSQSVPGQSTALCHSSGEWGTETPICKCNPGYEAVDARNGLMCRACVAGYFKSSDIDVCTPCPAHSTSDVSAASVCHCVHHHYRVNDSTKSPYGSPIESETAACTKAPSKPTNVRSEITNTTLTVLWELPASDGGRPQDMFYRVFLSPVLRSDLPEDQSGIISGTTRLSYTFRGLRPVTRYMVSVQAENAVSYHDDRVTERLEQLELTTAEGNPEEVFKPKAVDNVVLVWGPPTVPNGIITGYEIMLTFCATDLGIEGSAATMGNETEQMLLFPEEVECENASHTVDADTLFFVLNNDVLPDYEHNLTFSIRGKTGTDRYGLWSPEVTIVPKIVCPRPTITPATPPTCPPVECNETITIITSTVVTNASPTSSPDCELDDCVLYMAVTAGAIFAITTILVCVFVCSIACLCHKHKMKTYRINMKKQMQSKWEY